MNQFIDIEESSGNVFADLEVPNSVDVLAKAQLVARICELLNQRNINQPEAIELLGIAEADLSELVRGQFPHFSLEYLFGLLNRLDQDIEILIKPKTSTDWQGKVCVVVPESTSGA